MKWLFFCLIFKSFVGIILATACPNGTVQSITDQSICYLFSPKKYAYLKAESICVQNNGHLVSIPSMFDNVFLKQQAQMYFSSNCEFWIGATNLLTPRNWGWIDKSDFTFTDWQKGEPKNKRGLNCGAVKLRDGTWMAENCDKQNPFVCMITLQQTQTTTLPPLTTTTTKTSTSQISTTTTTATSRPYRTTPQKPKYCPESWVFSNITGFCYLVINHYTWLDAEKECASQNAHLASIHSSDENKFVNGLIPFNNQCQIYAWTGLHYVINNSSTSWKWTDNTPFDYSDWAINRPINLQGHQCGNLEDGHACAGNGSGSWSNGICYETFNYAICKKLPL